MPESYRRYAAHILGDIQTSSEAVIKALQGVLKDEDEQVRVNASSSLAKIQARSLFNRL